VHTVSKTRRLGAAVVALFLAGVLGPGSAALASTAGTQAWQFTSSGQSVDMVCQASGICSFAIPPYDNAFGGGSVGSMTVTVSGSVNLQFSGALVTVSGTETAVVNVNYAGAPPHSTSVTGSIDGTGQANATWPRASSASGSLGVSIGSIGSHQYAWTAKRISGGPVPAESTTTTTKAKGKGKGTTTSSSKPPKNASNKPQQWTLSPGNFHQTSGVRCTSGTCSGFGYILTSATSDISVLGHTFVTMHFDGSNVRISGTVSIVLEFSIGGSSFGPNVCTFSGEGTANAPWPDATRASGTTTNDCARPFIEGSSFGNWTAEGSKSKR